MASIVAGTVASERAGVLARQGIRMDHATLAAWVDTGADEAVLVVRRMMKIPLLPARLFADETSAPVLEKGRGSTKTD